MNLMKVVGIVLSCIGAAAAAGGLYWWMRRRRSAKSASSSQSEGASEGEDTSSNARDTPRGVTIDASQLDGLDEELDRLFPEGWPPARAVVDGLTAEDVVVFAVQSDAVGGYDQTRQELIQAKVLSVEPGVVRGRVSGEVDHAEHHGAHAGHGFRVGDLVEVPKDQVLAAIRPAPAEGYNSKGKADRILKPSDQTKERYEVRPGTPYDLVLPHWSERLEWYVSEDHVTVKHIGLRGLNHQVMFSEDSMRGPVSLRVLDDDPEVGHIHVARWDFEISES